MSDQSKLLEKNPQLDLKSGIHQNATALFRDSTLSNYIQIAVTEVFSKVEDKSLFSLDIETHTNTDELRSALSLSQFRFLQAFDLAHVHQVLDLSEDFGGVAHYVADHVGHVDAVKIDPDLARISVRRCANKHNITHISEDLDKLNFPTNHYDLIVLGQLEALALNADELDHLLGKLRNALSAKGVLVANAINSQRFSRWFDPTAKVSNGNLAYADLYSTSDASQRLVELSRKQLRDRLLNANFAAIDIHANFSKARDCLSLFSEDYLSSSVNGLNHFYRLGSFDNADLNEYLLYKNLVKQKHNLTDLANQYLVIAGASSEHTRTLYDNDFSHFPGSGRQPQWRTLTSRRRAATEVQKTALYPEYRDSETGLVQQNLTPQPFHKGKLLVDDWLQALADNDHDGFAQLVHEYTDWLNTFAQGSDFTQTAYDLLPFNLVLNTRGARAFNTIDTEWQINADFSADFVLFRALFWFAFENKSLLKAFADSNDIYSIGTFIVHNMPDIYQVDDLTSFVSLEEKIQSEIDHNFRANSVSNALLQTFEGGDDADDDSLQLEVVWANLQGEAKVAATQSTAWLKESDQTQTLTLSLGQVDAKFPILRIDPMGSNGAFKLHQISLRDTSGTIHWSTESAQNISKQANLNGLSLIDDVFIALNQDPYLSFDLSSSSDIFDSDSELSLDLQIEWLWGAHYSATLNALSTAVSSQNAAIIGQSHRLDQYRADVEFKARRIDDLVGHREDLTIMFQDEEQRAQQNRARMQAEIDHLNARLHAQHVRNDELHGYLLMRPTTRIKRVARRWLNKFTGKPMVEALAPVEPVVEVVQSSPLPTGELIGQNTEDYGLWVSENELTEQQIEAAKADIETMAIKPVFSILVPIYDVDPEYLLPMIESVRRQIYPHWQLCLVDDCSPKTYLKQILQHEALQDQRISIQLNETNQGISVTTNDALAMAHGDYIALLDHDDEISINALYENAKVINTTPTVGLIYSDEDKMDMQGNRLEPYFKPDFSPDLLHTNNYVCHFTVIKKSIADEIGGFREGLDGSQDHDIILRAADAAEQIVHIPKILYHWRKIPGSTAVVYDSKSYAWEAGRKAVEDLLKKHESGVRVEFGTLKGTYRVHREIKNEPLVSIIVPFKDKPELLDACLNSVLNRTSYRNFEIIGVSNSSSEPLTFERMQYFTEADSRVRFVEKNSEFNFSAICNYGVEQSKGDYIVLLNNDIEIITPDWIEQMLEHAQRDSVGAVGAKLLYPDGRIQHAGVVAGMVGAAGHPHKFFPDNHIGYHGRLHMVYNVSAVTGAMLMVSKKRYLEVGGLDEQSLAVAYNDIDFCLKLLDKGWFNVFTPHAKATHHESISRGYEDTDEKMQRLLREQGVFLARWAEFLKAGDPYYNPNLSLKNERFSLKFKD